MSGCLGMCGWVGWGSGLRGRADNILRFILLKIIIIPIPLCLNYMMYQFKCVPVPLWPCPIMY